MHQNHRNMDNKKIKKLDAYLKSSDNTSLSDIEGEIITEEKPVDSNIVLDTSILGKHVINKKYFKDDHLPGNYWWYCDNNHDYGFALPSSLKTGVIVGFYKDNLWHVDKTINLQQTHIVPNHNILVKNAFPINVNS